MMQWYCSCEFLCVDLLPGCDSPRSQSASVSRSGVDFKETGRLVPSQKSQSHAPWIASCCTHARQTWQLSRLAAEQSVGWLFASDKESVHWALGLERRAKANTWKYFTGVFDGELALRRGSFCLLINRFLTEKDECHMPVSLLYCLILLKFSLILVWKSGSGRNTWKGTLPKWKAITLHCL